MNFKKILPVLAMIFMASESPADPTVFRFHLVNEPSSLKPWEQKNSGSGYLLSQLTGTLLTYQDHQLTGNLASSCIFKKPTLVKCSLRKNLHWSDGKEIKAQDFIRGFQALISPENKAFRADILFPIKNAQKIFKGKRKKSELKVSSPAERVLEIELEKPDSEFLFALSNPLTAPIPESSLPNITDLRSKPSLWISSGAYEISEWLPQRKITLKPNTKYWKKNSRPTLEVIPVSEDSVALNLYEKGELSFLRRLPTLFIPKYKDRPDFFEVEQIRFDYFGFAPRWRQSLVLRRAVSRALPYSDLQKVYHSKGTPGCPGLPSHLLSEVPCVIFDPVEAQSEWQPWREKPRKFELAYSKQGGDNHKLTAEWVQSELKKNLGFSIEVTGLENQIFLDRLDKAPPDLFRKGIAPERPTCLSALENFGTGHPENYIQFSDPRFDRILKLMRESSHSKQKQNLCSEAVHLLIDPYWMIPTGPIYFAILANPEWTGWKLNELNQLDLSELRLKSSLMPSPIVDSSKPKPPTESRPQTKQDGGETKSQQRSEPAAQTD